MSEPQAAAEQAPEPPVFDVARHRRRLFVMVGVNGVCLVVAIVALVANMGFHIGWMMWVFLAALLAGFGAQGWLVLGLRR